MEESAGLNRSSFEGGGGFLATSITTTVCRWMIKQVDLEAAIIDISDGGFEGREFESHINDQ